MTPDIITLTRDELRQLIRQSAGELHKRLQNGESIDTIIDEEDPFAIFEPYLEPSEFPILVITMVNNFQSEKIMNIILDSLEEGFRKPQ